MPEKKYAEKKAEKKGYAIGNGSSIMMVYNLCEQEGNHKMREIRWAVLGTGVIANEMAAALEKNGKKLYAVGNRTYEKAVKLGKSMELERCIQIIMKCLRIRKWT